MAVNQESKFIPDIMKMLSIKMNILLIKIKT